MPKSTEEQAAAEEAAQRYILSKKQAPGDVIYSSEPGAHPVGFVQGTGAVQLVPQEFNVGREIVSCTLAHAVSVRGTETRTVSLNKLDFKSAGLTIVDVDRGLKISYTRTDGKRESLTTPWANVVEFRYGP